MTTRKWDYLVEADKELRELERKANRGDTEAETRAIEMRERLGLAKGRLWVKANLKYSDINKYYGFTRWHIKNPNESPINVIKKFDLERKDVPYSRVETAVVSVPEKALITWVGLWPFREFAGAYHLPKKDFEPYKPFISVRLFDTIKGLETFAKQHYRSVLPL